MFPVSVRVIPAILVRLAMLAVAATPPLASVALAQGTYQATPSTLGPIPDSIAGCGTDGRPLFVQVPVSGAVGGVTAVAVNMAITHTWMGEVTAVLIAPDGTSHVIFGRTRAVTPTDWGADSDLTGGPFTFTDTAAGNWWSASFQNPVPPGAYRTSEIGGYPGATGAVTAMNPVFAGREPNGTWRVRFTDSCRLDTGAVAALSLTLTTTGATGPPIAAVPDSFTAGLSTPLVVPAPGVLANDINAPGSGPLTATLQSLPTRGTIILNADGSFRYTPNPGYLGADSFTYYASNPFGSSPSTTVSLTVVPVQPPTNLRVERVVGNTVTLRWDPPAVGPVPTAYRVEGGVTPGSVQGSVTGGPAPVLTFQAPTGAFYIRVRALDGTMVSDHSNETRLFVNVPVAPSPPSMLTGLAAGNNLTLSWKVTYEGGEPTNLFLDVSGNVVTSIPLGVTESFQYAGVPDGTYTFTLRSVNAAGASTSSGPVTLTFSGECVNQGPPEPPRNFLFYRQGNEAHLLWDPPLDGTAPAGYVLNVTGAFVGTVPVGASRRFSATVPPGTYNVSVVSVNACGTSEPTPVRSLQVP